MVGRLHCYLDEGTAAGAAQEAHAAAGRVNSFDTLNALYAEFFPTAAPARSTPVVQLPRGLLFSIEAVAVAALKSSTA
jgi:2-iminobutanoate/2-iminopropanoate deaminase